MKETELKPCPFCGGKAHIYQDYTGYYVAQCDKCGIGTLLCGDKRTAKRRWNRRADNEQREGKWIKATPYSQEYCNQCGLTPKTIFGKLPPFCPNCGARMKGGE